MLKSYFGIGHCFSFGSWRFFPTDVEAPASPLEDSAPTIGKGNGGKVCIVTCWWLGAKAGGKGCWDIGGSGGGGWNITCAGKGIPPSPAAISWAWAAICWTVLHISWFKGGGYWAFGCFPSRISPGDKLPDWLRLRRCRRFFFRCFVSSDINELDVKLLKEWALFEKCQGRTKLVLKFAKSLALPKSYLGEVRSINSDF